MTLSDWHLLALATAFYGGGMLLGILQLVRKQRHSRPLMWTFLGAGLATQTAGLYLRGMAIGACPLGNPFEILQFIVWSSVLIVLVVGPVFQVRLLGLFCSAVATGISILAFVIPGLDYAYTGSLFGGDPVVELHAALSIFSYGMLALLGMVAVMYLVQFRALELKRHSALLAYLPSVMQLDALQTRTLIAALVLLTVAVGSGVFLLDRDLPEFSKLKFMMVCAVWLGYSLALLLRMLRRITARHLATVSLILLLFAISALGPVDQARHRGPAGPVIALPENE